VTLDFGDHAADLHWPCLRLVDAGWCDLAGLRHLTCEDVDLANLTLDTLERARREAERDR
jgi:hypothetical protein